VYLLRSPSETPSLTLPFHLNTSLIHRNGYIAKILSVVTVRRDPGAKDDEQAGLGWGWGCVIYDRRKLVN
jgi:hypothetical protein